MELITQRKVGEKTLTIIDVGEVHTGQAERIKENVQGKTYMDFGIIAAPSPGGRHVSVQTTYEGTKEDIMGMFVYLMAASI